MPKRILSGIKPTGRPHLGNYLGAIRQHIALQDEGHECLYFVADYHALTTVHKAEDLKNYRRGVVLDYLALGLDPQKVTFISLKKGFSKGVLILIYHNSILL